MAYNVTTAPNKWSKSKTYDTVYSHVVPHHSTNTADTRLTSEIRRDPVLSGAYGRTSCRLAVHVILRRRNSRQLLLQSTPLVASQNNSSLPLGNCSENLPISSTDFMPVIACILSRLSPPIHSTSCITSVPILDFPSAGIPFTCLSEIRESPYHKEQASER